MKQFFKEFKEFISKGNVLDLAIAVVIGNTFNAIVKSLVDDIIMPFVGIIIGGIHFDNIQITIGDSSIMIGLFIQNVVNFLIVALTVFLVIKIVNRLTKNKQHEKEKNTKKADNIILLEEIRDLLKEQTKKSNKNKLSK